MKFIQHLLSKGLLIAIAILAALGYHFRTDLFPQWFAAPAPEEQAAQQTRPMDTSSMVVPQAPPPIAVVPAPVQDIPAAPLETPPAPLLDPMPEQTEQMPPPRFRPEDVPESAAAMPQKSAPPSSNDAAAAAVPAVEATTSAASLDAARAAFWAQDFTQAEQLYQQLASADPAAADPLGELGNLYYAQGRWNDAADAYAGAVTRLAAVGDMPRARHLLRVLDGLDPARAQAVWESISVGGG